MLRHPTDDVRGALSVAVDREMPLSTWENAVGCRVSRLNAAIHFFGKCLLFPPFACRRSLVISRVARSAPSGSPEIKIEVLAACWRAKRTPVKSPCPDVPSGDVGLRENGRRATKLFRKDTCSALVTGFSKER